MDNTIFPLMGLVVLLALCLIGFSNVIEPSKPKKEG